jgi:hypothetical protein
MKTSFLKLLSAGFLFLFVLGIMFHPLKTKAQDAQEDTVAAVQDNSSSFNDSVQFDDMEPIFYEAADDDATEKVASESSNIMLYAGIAVVLLVVLIVLKQVGKKKS